MKRLIAAAVCFIMLMFASALCEDAAIVYGGEAGVVKRETAVYQTRALIEEMNVAYLEADSPYLTMGRQIRFTAHVTGGDGRYTYSFAVFRRSGTHGLFYQQAASTNTSSNVFYFTPKTETGQYILQIRVTDSAGSYIEWQSRVFESAQHASSAKARSLAEECMRSATTDYARALWLHDWLIYNADYDYTYTYYYPDGVLLNGKGVCQSYALAYEMLLKLVGIDSVYVTGTANGESHGWNLVKIDEKWFHVDCTWDDPAPGEESHDYFCVPDNIISKDHIWHDEVQILPESTEKSHMYAIRSGADTCENESQMKKILNDAVLNKLAYVEIWYTGDRDGFDFKSAYEKWYERTSFPIEFRASRYVYDKFCLKVEFDFGNGFSDLKTPQKMVIDQAITELDPGENMHLLILTVPSGASKNGVTYSSSNPDCISVDPNGLVQAHESGISVITAVHPNGQKASIELIVHSGGVLILPGGMTRIEDGAFMDCALLETVIVPDGVLTIGENAFSSCPLLSLIRIPQSVEYIGENAFSGCSRVVIECAPGSYAQRYAQERHIAYRIVSNQP